MSSSFGKKESCDSLVQNDPLLDLQGVLAEEEDLLAAVHVDHGAAEVVVEGRKLCGEKTKWTLLHFFPRKI